MVRSIKNLIAAVMISISGFLILSTLLPKYENFSVLEATIEVRSVNLETRKKIVQKLAELKELYSDKYSELQRLALVVPSKKSFPELISTLEAISIKNGVTMNGLELGGGVPGGTFNVISFQTGIEAPYESLLGFLGYLERNLRLMDLNELSIGEDMGEGESNNLSLQFRGQVYYLEAEDEIKAVPQGTISSEVKP